MSHGSPGWWMSNFTRIVKTQVILWTFHVKDVILWNLTFIFSDSVPWGIFVSVITDDLLHLEVFKNVKRNPICFKFSGTRFFVHWKSKLHNFMVDSVLTLHLINGAETNVSRNKLELLKLPALTSKWWPGNCSWDTVVYCVYFGPWLFIKNGNVWYADVTQPKFTS